jgi:hypothetical protein
MQYFITKSTSYDISGKLIYQKIGMHNRSGSIKSLEIGNACHTRQRIKTKQKQAKNEHNVRWKPLSASKHK